MTVRLTKARLPHLLAGDAASPGIHITGDPQVLHTLLGFAHSGDPDLPIAAAASA